MGDARSDEGPQLSKRINMVVRIARWGNNDDNKARSPTGTASASQQIGLSWVNV